MSGDGWGSGWDNQVVNQVIIVGPAGQLLVYSPTEGAGKLIASVSGQAGTDSFGNIYLPGVTSYNGTSTAVSFTQGSVQFFTFGAPVPGTWNQFSTISSDTWFFNEAGENLFFGNAGDLLAQIGLTATQTIMTATGDTAVTTALLELQGEQAIALASAGTALEILEKTDADPRFTISESGVISWGTGAVATDTVVSRAGAGLLSVPTITTDSWHSLSALYGAGFADGSPASFYRHEPQGSTSAVVRLQGTFVLTANEGSGTTVLTLPVGYRPAQAMRFWSVSNLSGAVVTSATLTLSTAGVLALGVAGTNGDFVQLDGITFPTDN